MSNSCTVDPCPTVSEDASSAPDSSLLSSPSSTQTNSTSKLLELSDANFDAEVLQSTQPVLVDFWAPWCGPCQMIGPVVEQLATENAGVVKVGKVNVDDSPGTAARWGVDGIPTLMLFKNGQIVDRFVGVQSAGHLQEAIDRLKD